MYNKSDLYIYIHISGGQFGFESCGILLLVWNVCSNRVSKFSDHIKKNEYRNNYYKFVNTTSSCSNSRTVSAASKSLTELM